MRKNKLSTIFIALLFSWLALGILSTRFNLPVPSKPNPNFTESLYDYSGSVHFHTQYSHDASGTLPEIVGAAQKANLDFIILTDHGKENAGQITEGQYRLTSDGLLIVNPPPSKKGEGQPPKPILVMAGSEIGTDLGHHLEIGPNKILAHPFHPIVPWKKPEDLHQFQGMEIITGSTLLNEALRKVFPALWALLIYPFNQDYGFFSIYQYPEREMKLWDQWCQKKKLAGIIATDAHANIVLWKEKGWRIKFPSYLSAFKGMKMHLLAQENLHSMPFKKSKEILFGAIGDGKGYLSFDLLLDPAGFTFRIKSKDSKSIIMGETFILTKKQDPVFQIKLGKNIPLVPKEIRFYRNGTMIASANSEGLELDMTEPGVYRSEVYLVIKNIFGLNKKVLWIASNPIFVK